MEKSLLSLTKELSQGQNLAKHLQSLLLLHSSSTPEMRDSLLQSILSCYDRALSSLVQDALSVEPFDPDSSGKRHRGDALKRKRKDEGDSTEIVRVEGGQLEEDGYSWRKYGQKRILDAKYPRGYFRCTHRPGHGCLAKKLVQRSDDDPSLFQVTYRGSHTCIPPISTKSDHQDPIVSASSIPEDAGTTLQMDVKEHIFPPFSSLAMPGIMAGENVDAKGTYSDVLAQQGTLLDNFNFDLDQGLREQTSESSLVEIFSAPTSVTNSPVVFPLHELGFDQEFPFDYLEFSREMEPVKKPKWKETTFGEHKRWD